jgi:hypothetical protein
MYPVCMNYRWGPSKLIIFMPKLLETYNIKADGLYFVIGISGAQETTLLLWLAIGDLPMLVSIRAFPLLFVGSTVG